MAVLDGDTIRVRLDEGAEETVRLLGVDAPALSEPHGVQARDFLAYLVLARPLEIFFDVQQRDEQGNLLAYVGTMDFGGLVNVEMLRMGLARLSDDALDLMDPENHDMFAAAQAAAQASHLGIWADVAP